MDEFLKYMEINKIATFLINEPLSKHTTWKIGGVARVFVTPSTINELSVLVRCAAEFKVPVFTLGKGSNILCSEEGFDGLVIRLNHTFEEMAFEDNVAFIGAGYSLIKLSQELAMQGWSGLEFAGGIPGSLGGAVYMNAGAHGSSMEAIVKRVHVILEDGSPQIFNRNELDFAYRHSSFQINRAIIVAVELELVKSTKEDVKKLMQIYNEKRKSSQPVNQACAGSVFRNPQGYSAGALIEQAGLKGFCIGDAEVSMKHANFIINKGNATSSDVSQLIHYIQKEIKHKYDVMLETEIKMLVQDQSPSRHF
jgi:UDP-N-acetylmuramate dehydrogenase